MDYLELSRIIKRTLLYGARYLVNFTSKKLILMITEPDHDKFIIRLNELINIALKTFITKRRLRDTKYRQQRKIQILREYIFRFCSFITFRNSFFRMENELYSPENDYKLYNEITLYTNEYNETEMINELKNHLSHYIAI